MMIKMTPCMYNGQTGQDVAEETDSIDDNKFTTWYKTVSFTRFETSFSLRQRFGHIQVVLILQISALIVN